MMCSFATFCGGMVVVPLGCDAVSCYGSVMHANDSPDSLSLQQNDPQTLLHVFSSLAQSSSGCSPAFLSKFLSALSQTGEQCGEVAAAAVDESAPSAKRTKIKIEP